MAERETTHWIENSNCSNHMCPKRLTHPPSKKTPKTLKALKSDHFKTTANILYKGNADSIYDIHYLLIVIFKAKLVL